MTRLGPAIMYEIEIEESFAAAHQLVGYAGKCSHLHGHNWRVQVGLAAAALDANGLLMDFQELKQITRGVLEQLDHTHLNDHPYFKEVSPTAENVSRWIFDQVAGKLPAAGVQLTHVRVHETDRYSALYRRLR